MKKITILLVIGVIVVSIGWQGAKAERDALREQAALSTIVGSAYEDRGDPEVLDWPDRPAEELIIELYRMVEGEGVLIAETLVSTDGQYSFKVEPGTYYVIPVLRVSGYPGWKWVTYLRNPGNIRAKEGETHLATIFLVRENEPPR